MLWKWIKQSMLLSSRPKRAFRRGSKAFLHVEQLSERITPVVGHTAVDDAPIVPFGTSGYTGVVRLRTVSGSATASLLNTGRHLLTAAHVGTSMDAFFELLRAGQEVTVSIPIIPNGVDGTWQIKHPNWDGNADHGNDIAVLRLSDPVVPGVDRYLVPPFGADQYSLYFNRDEVGGQVSFVGYGDPGTGSKGQGANPEGSIPKRKGDNQVDIDGSLLNNAIQSIKISGGPTEGTFQLEYSGKQTANIPIGANLASDLEDAVTNLSRPSN